MVGNGANLSRSHCCQSTMAPASSPATPSLRESKKDSTKELFCLKGLDERLPRWNPAKRQQTMTGRPTPL